MNLTENVASEVEGVLTAARKVVYEYPGGIDAIAKNLGRSTKYLKRSVELSNKAKLNVNDAIKISNFTGDYRILDAFGKPFGLTFAKLPPPTLTTEDPKEHLTSCIRGFSMHLLSVSSLKDQETNNKFMACAIVDFGEFTKVALELVSKKCLSTNELIRLNKPYMAITSSLLKISQSNPLITQSIQLSADLKAVYDGFTGRLYKPSIY